MIKTEPDLTAEAKADKSADNWLNNITHRTMCEAIVRRTSLTKEEEKALKHIYKAGYVQAMEDDAMTALLASTGGE